MVLSRVAGWKKSCSICLQGEIGGFGGLGEVRARSSWCGPCIRLSLAELGPVECGRRCGQIMQLD